LQQGRGARSGNVRSREEYFRLTRHDRNSLQIEIASRKRCFALHRCCQERPQSLQSRQVYLARPLKIRLSKPWPVELGSETLLPPRVMRRRIRATKITSNDPTSCTELPKGPLQISQREPAALPVRHRFFNPQAIEIDRHVDILASETLRKLFKVLA